MSVSNAERGRAMYRVSFTPAGAWKFAGMEVTGKHIQPPRKGGRVRLHRLEPVSTRSARRGGGGDGRWMYLGKAGERVIRIGSVHHAQQQGEVLSSF